MEKPQEMYRTGNPKGGGWNEEFCRASPDRASKEAKIDGNQGIYELLLK